VRSGTIARTRGPNPPAGTAAGNSARVAAPQAGQINRCHWSSVTLGGHWQELGHLIPLGLGILPVQEVLTACTAPTLDGHHHIHRFHPHQGPIPPGRAGLSPGVTPTGPAARSFTQSLGRIARWRPGRGARVLLQLPRQLLDRCWQALDSGLQTPPYGLRGYRCRPAPWPGFAPTGLGKTDVLGS
jgi:hypothetical protein